jgi:uncharacterized oxidoreductase
MNETIHVDHEELRRMVSQMFAAGGCQADEAERIAHYLVESNLAGHDSHGVIRAPIYLNWLAQGKVRANQRPVTIFENEAMVLIDGQQGFGQTVAEHAMRVGIEKSAKHGIAMIGVQNSGHMGRIGDWPQLVAQAGMASLHFVNTSGLGLLVAPFGGIDRRLSANPIAAGIPVAGRDPIILDISTSTVAEGKLKVARNKREPVPEGCIIDSEGRPTTDPEQFYGDPPGALLPMAGHKGYGLCLITEIFAGAIAGSGCSKPGETALRNGLLSIIIDLKQLPHRDRFDGEVGRFLDFVQSSRRASPDAEILIPGDIERRTREHRIANGIPLDQQTWRGLEEAGGSMKNEG